MINKITQQDLDLHAKWINGKPDGVRLVTAYGKIEIDADLSGADLRVANLRRANLSAADLRGAKNGEMALALTNILPDGDLIGWKKLRGEAIAKLRIPADAKRSNATGRKCRAEYAVVLEITTLSGDTQLTDGVSQYDGTVIYRVGETVLPTKPFDENRWEECASGIHFFITRIEAQNY